jgi:aspartyl-tRNA(Asn)/glutamyl-tRNA(Gln) amidotransferase subunit A
VTRAALEFGMSIPAVRYLEAITYRGKALVAFEAAVLARIDALLTPATPVAAPSMQEVEAYLAERGRLPFNLARNTKPANYLGLPAIAVPCGFTGTGLPVALQLVGRPFAEALLLNLGHAYQTASDFHQKIPPVRLPRAVEDGRRHRAKEVRQ